MKERCRHERNSWLMASATFEWCYRCGAIRRLRDMGGNSCAPDGPWLRPVGPDGENPWGAYQRALEQYRERRGELAD